MVLKISSLEQDVSSLQQLVKDSAESALAGSNELIQANETISGLQSEVAKLVLAADSSSCLTMRPSVPSKI
jgi:hypothetical protein